jgi:phosphoserine phosphatase
MSKSFAHVATFVAGPNAELTAGDLTRALREAGLAQARLDWLDPGRAADAIFSAEAAAADRLRETLREGFSGRGVDAILQPAAARRKALLVADMDSTMIGQECVDELAEFVGLRERVAAITERAMRGEIEFEGALKERVALLEGLPAAAIDEIVETRIVDTPGARALVATMRAHGAHTALVSGGFTLFTERIAARLGFHEQRANRLDVAGGALTGRVIEPILGREAKRAALEELRSALALPVEGTLAIGDGANDLDMLLAAGLGVAFHAKPKVAAAAAARIDHADLTALLFAQGYRNADIVG